MLPYYYPGAGVWRRFIKEDHVLSLHTQAGLPADDGATVMAQSQPISEKLLERVLSSLSDDKAEDVVQTTWLTLVRRHESIVEPQAVSGWLTTTARREAWRVGRQQRRADPTEVDDLEPHLPTHESAEQTALRDDASRRLWLAENQLNERCQRLLRVVAFDERPDYARIATDLAMPIGSIGPTRQRCLGKLRAILAEEGEDGRDDDG